MAKSKKDVEGGLGIHARRAIAYIVLIIISFFCLFWFYIMFINATRSKGELKAGFTALPSDHLLTNWNNLVHVPPQKNPCGPWAAPHPPL